MKPDCCCSPLPHCLILAVLDVISVYIRILSICTHIDKSVGTEISKEAITLYFCKAIPNPQMKITENVQAVITAEALLAG